jgi:6-pyruvoyltetrahydropterin/6-carboxytetrahydropterin synthase
MYEIEKRFTFEAGHVLKNHDGKCAFPHGHSYTLAIVLRSPTLIANGPKTNMIMDCTDIKAIVQPMIEKYLDHRWLNDTLPFEATTVEAMTKWIYDHLKPQIPQLYSITLWEAATLKATYYGE